MNKVRIGRIFGNDSHRTGIITAGGARHRQASQARMLILAACATSHKTEIEREFLTGPGEKRLGLTKTSEEQVTKIWGKAR